MSTAQAKPAGKSRPATRPGNCLPEWAVTSFLLAVVSAVLWACAVGYFGNPVGQALTAATAGAVILNGAFAIYIYLLSLKRLFAEKDWVSAATLSGACASFLITATVAASLLAALSAGILGVRMGGMFNAALVDDPGQADVNKALKEFQQSMKDLEQKMERERK